MATTKKAQAVNVPATIAAAEKIWAVVAQMLADKKVTLATIMALAGALMELYAALTAPGAVALSPARFAGMARRAGLPVPKPGAADRYLARRR